MYKEISTEYLREKRRILSREIDVLKRQEQDIKYELENKLAIFNGLSTIIEERDPELQQATVIE